MQPTSTGGDVRGRHVVWIINHYAGHPSESSNGSRHHYLAANLSRYGWDAIVIACGSPHNASRHRERRSRRSLVDYGDSTFLWLPSNRYSGNGVGRLANMLLFTGQALWPRSTDELRAPDVVVGSSVHPLAAWAGMRLARRHGVPFVFEVRDLWPETLIEMGRISRDSRMARALAALELSLYRGAERIVTTMPFAVDYISTLGVRREKVVWISNGTNPDDFSESPQPRGRPFVLMYFGSHGHANGLESILRATAIAVRSLPAGSLTFRLIGEGPLKPQLIRLCADLGLSDVVSFEDSVPKSRIPKVARESHALILNLLDLPLYRFGVSMNKLFDYMSSGRPIIFAGSPPNNPIEDAAGGVTVPSDDIDGMADAILKVFNSSISERAQWAQNAIQHVRLHYSYSVLAGRLATVLNESRQ